MMASSRQLTFRWPHSPSFAREDFLAAPANLEALRAIDAWPDWPGRMLLIVGPPGAGKGTQAEKLAEKLEIPQISTGELFRQNIGDGTKLGLEAKRYLDAGDLVPAELTNQMKTELAANAKIVKEYNIKE